MGSFKFVLLMCVLIATLKCSSSHRNRNRDLLHPKFNDHPSIRTCLSEEVLRILREQLCPGDEVNPCQNGGIEQADGTCDCTDGFTGDTCEDEVNPCQNGGTELSDGTCDCTDEFTGDTCDDEANPCQNGGTHQADGTCDCTDGYSGPLCDMRPCESNDFPSRSCVSANACTFVFTTIYPDFDCDDDDQVCCEF